MQHIAASRTGCQFRTLCGKRIGWVYISAPAEADCPVCKRNARRLVVAGRIDKKNGINFKKEVEK